MKTTTIFRLAILLVALGGTALYGQHWHHEHHLAPGMRGQYVQNTLHINGTKIHYWLADTKEKQAKGLLGVTSLDAHDGMLFVYPKPVNTAFHMRGMKIPLDFVWIRHGSIVDLQAHVQPQPRLSPKLVTTEESFDQVLELKAGSIDKFQLHVGNPVKLRK